MLQVGGLDIGGTLGAIQSGGVSNLLLQHLADIGGDLLANSQFADLGRPAMTVAQRLMNGNLTLEDLVSIAAETGVASDQPIPNYVLNDVVPGLINGRFNLNTVANGLTALGVQFPPLVQTFLSLGNGGGGGSLVRTPDFNPNP
ncbi:MAG: hypothetical protein EA385_11300 [Salinarimonadaceae bacterium]|nr:MAG: hypothetical protein EA385_11300 [Salinarimonadaceae bacterium]